MIKEITNPICLALDSPDRDRIRDLVAATAGSVGSFKVGLTAFSAWGGDIVEEVARTKPVFLDLKLHDIPAQVEGAVAAAVALGASWTTVHASAGEAALRAATAGSAGRLEVLAVTVLTSLADDDLARIGMPARVSETVLTLADLALEAGVPGIVCSPREVALLRGRFGGRAEGGPILVVPGVRPRGAPADDQKRTMSPQDALDAGADMLVVGRPVTEAPDPAAAARSLAAEIGA